MAYCITRDGKERRYDVEHLTEEARKNLQEDLIALWKDRNKKLRKKSEMKDIPYESQHCVAILSKADFLLRQLGEGTNSTQTLSHEQTVLKWLVQSGPTLCAKDIWIYYDGEEVFLASYRTYLQSFPHWKIVHCKAGPWEESLEKVWAEYWEKIDDDKLAMVNAIGGVVYHAFRDEFAKLLR